MDEGEFEEEDGEQGVKDKKKQDGGNGGQDDIEKNNNGLDGTDSDTDPKLGDASDRDSNEKGTRKGKGKGKGSEGSAVARLGRLAGRRHLVRQHSTNGTGAAFESEGSTGLGNCYDNPCRESACRSSRFSRGSSSYRKYVCCSIAS